jgi:DNA modification methylase
MLSVLEAQMSARKNPELLLQGFVKNSQYAKVLHDEMKERKIVEANSDENNLIMEKLLTYDLTKDWKNLKKHNVKGGNHILDFYTKIERFKSNVRKPVFTPYQMYEALKDYDVSVILDPMMGWGGRLLGACSIGAKHYIGIDSNHDLVYPYHNLRTFIESKNGGNTHISLMFRDCMKIDYSTFDYDCVFTSPPYYDSDSMRTVEEWNELFYRPFVTNTWANLKENGVYALNLNPDVYAFITTIIGEAERCVPTMKGIESVYVWKKPPNVEYLQM